jgi:hypothetical protein
VPRVKARQSCYPCEFHSLVTGASVCPIRANQSPILFINQGCRLLPISLWNYTILNNTMCNDKKKAKKTNFYLTEVNISKMQSLQKIAAASNSKSIGTHGVSMSSNENRKFDFSSMNPHLHVYLQCLEISYSFGWHISHCSWTGNHNISKLGRDLRLWNGLCNASKNWVLTFAPTSSTLLTFESIRHKGEQAGLNQAHDS